MSRRRRRSLRPFLDVLDDRCLLSGFNLGPQGGYTPEQIRTAYGLNAMTFGSGTGSVQGDGSGETIAVIETYHDPNITADLHTFDQQYGLPDPNLTVDNLAGDQTDSNWALEESMDVEWAHAMAPGASILVVEAAPGFGNAQDLQNLMAAVNTASATPGVVAVSMSWGFSEFPGESVYDANFTTPGITYVAASGDSPGAEYPAASPDVLSVGGTTLVLDGQGAIQSETAWTDSGGGYSPYELEPGYQQFVQMTGQRSVPDVAFDADPNTGVAVYATTSSGGPGPWGQTASQGSWHVVGGTSLGAPAWAAIVAIADQGRALAGLGSLTGATQTLPSLYQVSANDLHTIASSPGSSPWIANSGGLSWGGLGILFGGSGTSAGATANTQTGIGTPAGASLVDDLSTSTITATLFPTTSTPATPSPTTTTGQTGHHHHHKRRGHPHARKPAHLTHVHARRVVVHKAGSHPAAHYDRVAHTPGSMRIHPPVSPLRKGGG